MSYIIRLVSVVLLLTSLMVVPAGAATVVPRLSTDIISGEYIVVLKSGVRIVSATESVARSYGIITRHRYTRAINGFSAKLNATQLRQLRADTRVKIVVPNRRVHLATEPQVTTGPTETMSLRRINLVPQPTGGQGIDVAVIDTGINYFHPEFSGRVAGGVDCINDGSGFMDLNSHGTHVAGIIGAAADGIGTTGVAPAVRLWAVRVLDAWGGGDTSTVICGLDFVTSNGPANGGVIDVANLSLGQYGSSGSDCGLTDNDLMHEAMCRARDAGVVLVVAAGNSAYTTDYYTPAGYNDAVITVSAFGDTDGKPSGLGPLTEDGELDDAFASFSNYGAAVDIGAPGVAVYSTELGRSYGYKTGTSMSSPFVAGAAALYLAKYPGASWKNIRDFLISTGEKASPLHVDPFGRHPEPLLNLQSFTQSSTLDRQTSSSSTYPLVMPLKPVN